MNNNIIIPEKIIKKIFKNANNDKPLEICGYLLGVDNIVKDIYPMTNIDKSAEHFAFEPSEQFKAVKTARAKSLNLIAVYHSHPETPARMSDEDIRLAVDTEIYYIICSLLTNDIKCFKIDNKKQITDIEILRCKNEVL